MCYGATELLVLFNISRNKCDEVTLNVSVIGTGMRLGEPAGD